MRIFLVVISILLLSSCNTEEKDRILFIGDSHVHKWDLDFYFDNSINENSGVSGDRIEDVVAKIETIDFDKYDKTFLQIGSNNISSAVSLNQDLNLSIEILNVKMVSLVNRIDQEGKELFLSSIIPFRKDYFEEIDGCVNLELFNAKLSEIANANSRVKYIDLANALAEDNCLNEKFLVDNLHLNRDGYQRISIDVKGSLYE